MANRTAGDNMKKERERISALIRKGQLAALKANQEKFAKSRELKAQAREDYKKTVEARRGDY